MPPCLKISGTRSSKLNSTPPFAFAGDTLVPQNAMSCGRLLRRRKLLAVKIAIGFNKIAADLE